MFKGSTLTYDLTSAIWDFRILFNNPVDTPISDDFFNL